MFTDSLAACGPACPDLFHHFECPQCEVDFLSRYKDLWLWRSAAFFKTSATTSHLSRKQRANLSSAGTLVPIRSSEFLNDRIMRWNSVLSKCWRWEIKETFGSFSLPHINAQPYVSFVLTFHLCISLQVSCSKSQASWCWKSIIMFGFCYTELDMLPSSTSVCIWGVNHRLWWQIS